MTTTPANQQSAPSLAGLRSLFYPRSIALVGASERSPWSHMLHDNLVRLGYEGQVHAVNRTGSNAHGYWGYTSCATIAQIADLAHDLNIGISLYIATGNEAMLDIAACVNFLVEDEATRVIMVFAESIRDTATFSAAARRAAQKRKAIVVLKVGTT